MPLIVIYIASAMLFIGILPLPYGYYTLLRFIATGVFIWSALIAYERNNETLPWIYLLLALLFNPLIKIHLSRDLWAIFDISAATLLLVTKSIIKEKT